MTINKLCHSYNPQAITAIKHKQRQAKQARETCFSMLITTVCLFNICIMLTLVFLSLAYAYALELFCISLSFTTGSSYKQGLLCLKDSRNKRKTERSGVLMLITTVCLFSICITLTLVFYRWHTLSLYSSSLYHYHTLTLHSCSYIAIALSFTDYLAAYFP